jgi:hypothetical protein
VLTPAEHETATFSDRFAAHMIRQHQFSALCRARGWRYALQGAWDTPDVDATFALPEHNLRVRFLVERQWGDDVLQEIGDSGVFTLVTTDQVQFVDNQTNDLLHLDRIPVRAFSEVMRDVDLFVGVCSIGADPTWGLRDQARPFDEYWGTAAFGELGPTGETRRDVLVRLLPKLAIAPVASIDGRFLRIAGTRRTYRIHLGSTNIQMEPNNEYLCIVRGRDDTASKVYLPFEGDGGLALILSKAFLLAADAKITDPTINAQINR